ncbi:MAG: molybdopterin oxidoreductase family protein, partial [Acidimicrobiales bacterium]
ARADPAAACAAEALATGSVVCVVGRPSLAESPAPVVEAAGALLAARPQARFLPVLRRANVHGALDMGLAPGLLPGRVGLEEGRRWFSGAWGPLPAEAGLDAAGTLAAAAEGRITGLVLLGADPLADFPDRDLARRALDNTGFVLAVDCFLTESARQADVVLPAAGYAEKPGTTTNLEGRVSRLNQKVTPPGTARPDWMIAAELAARLDGDLGLESWEGIWDEIERLAPSHAGITRARLASPEGRDGIVAGAVDDVATTVPPTMAQTEAPEIAGAESQMGQDRLAVTGSGAEADPGGTGPSGPPPPGPTDRPPPLRFTPPVPTPPPAVGADTLRLVSSRRLYDGGTLVQRSPSLAGLVPGARLRVNPAHLDRLGVASGDRVRVTSRRGAVVVAAVADPEVPAGTAHLAFNQPGALAADLIDAARAVTEVRLERPG